MTYDPPDRLFPEVRFALALSLGGNCETARGLRIAGRHRTKGLFDWLVTPIDAISSILADDGARLGTEFVAVQNGTSVRCKAYDLLYHHEFPRDTENRVIFSAEAVARCRAKLNHKMASFLAAGDAGPVLFIRFGVDTDLAWDRIGAGKAAATAGDLDSLAAALERRFPALEFRILNVVLAPGPASGFGRPSDARIAIVSLLRETEGAWAVGDAAWRGLLARLDFTDEARKGNDEIGEALYWFGIDRSSAVADAPPPLPGSAPAQEPLGALDAALTSNDDGVALALLARLVRDGAAPVDRAWRIGQDWWRRGRSAAAMRAFRIAFEHGFREPLFLEDHVSLLTGETEYAEVLSVIDCLTREGLEAQQANTRRLCAMFSGHAKLALAQPRLPAIEAAEAREASPAWLDVAALEARIAGAIADRRPFAFIRVGDGEARFLLAATHDANALISAAEADAMGDVCWENWFGEPLAAAGDAPRTTVFAAYHRAVQAADVIGASTSNRLMADTGHYGYLAWQETWLRDITAGRTDLKWTDAFANRFLEARSPFLSMLLRGQDVIGVITPHPGLAGALGRALGIDRVVAHVVPAEGRLPTAGETRSLGRHFPDIYNDLLATLTVPRPGCVFLVAAGLLGKIYCARVKELGGIALDIGALSDAWMGYDTRDGQLAAVTTLPPTPALHASDDAAESRRGTTYGCISFMKTGSMALTTAILDAGFPDAIHLHYLGPRALEFRRAHPDDTIDLATKIASRVHEPGHRFTLVTSVRDPIARLVSQAFYEASVKKENIYRDHAALVRWWDNQPISRFDVLRLWFDDTFKETFGFDFRRHPFDHERKSVRFTNDRLRLLVLRTEDPTACREAEIGWLLERADVKLRSINDAENQGYLSAYRDFLKDFRAPERWLDELYETDVIRHFYTSAERDAFRHKWRGAARPALVRLPDVEPRRLACISMRKTSSTALVSALKDAGFDDARHMHHLGPRITAARNIPGDQAEQFAVHLKDPRARFGIVSCMRDPVARLISQAFHLEIEILARTGRSVVDSEGDFIDWVDANVPPNHLSEWFKDTLEATFGFDYKAHPFDFTRQSLRFDSDRLRLVILRQEDPIVSRERELGWLVERARIEIPTANVSAKRFADRYTAFVNNFVAPEKWLDLFYETTIIRHFYTKAERDAFRARWRGAGSRSVPVASLDDRLETEASATTYVTIPLTEPAVTKPKPQEPASKTETELDNLKLRLRDGYVVDFNDYAYRPRKRDWSKSNGIATLRSRFEASKARYAARLEDFCSHDTHFRAIPFQPDGVAPYWENWWLAGLDAVALYGMVASSAPRTFMEIGSGHSTRFVRRAIEDHGLATRIVSIDPNPIVQIDTICDEVIRARCEDAPLSPFAALEAGDILYFDGTHRSFQNSDTTVFFTEILPMLAPGVVYGLNNIFLPHDYPESWLTRFYNEQYLFLAYLLGGAGGDEILFPAHHVSRDPVFAARLARLCEGTRHIDWLASSFWMRRAEGG